ncbi:hypothetical protein BLNAU_2956 [Blattamonas nauphoetae]|uniref:Uncharacterized protein n=1 Tax=Blattamonas nauphoetae TaxID=2049346 RepID=A0ABQ9YDQ3_9EUKA|nr:hypothetical protein BLNAU_2956 [Blattamonas nauphoetae]
MVRTVVGSALQAGAIEIAGGEVEIRDLALSLSSFRFSLATYRPLFVVHGSGSLFVERVEIKSSSESVDVGLASLSSGSMVGNEVDMNGMTFANGTKLITCESGSNTISMQLTRMKMKNVKTTNTCLVDFSSSSASSSFSLSDSSFLNCNALQSASSLRIPLFDVNSAQTSTSIASSVFENCGGTDSSGQKLSPALHVHLSSPSSSYALLLTECLFLNCALPPSTKLGGVVVTLPSRPSSLTLTGSWFEATTSSSASFARNEAGFALLDTRRKVAYPTSASLVGLAIERGALVPSVNRRGSTFNNCQLLVVSNSALSSTAS